LELRNDLAHGEWQTVDEADFEQLYIEIDRLMSYCAMKSRMRRPLVLLRSLDPDSYLGDQSSPEARRADLTRFNPSSRPEGLNVLLVLLGADHPALQPLQLSVEEYLRVLDPDPQPGEVLGERHQVRGQHLRASDPSVAPVVVQAVAGGAHEREQRAEHHGDAIRCVLLEAGPETKLRSAGASTS